MVLGLYIVPLFSTRTLTCFCRLAILKRPSIAPLYGTRTLTFQNWCCIYIRCQALCWRATRHLCLFIILLLLCITIVLLLLLLHRLAGSLPTSYPPCQCSTCATWSSAQPPRRSFCASAARCLAFIFASFFLLHLRSHRDARRVTARRGVGFYLSQRDVYLLFIYLLIIIIISSFCASAARCWRLFGKALM